MKWLAALSIGFAVAFPSSLQATKVPFHAVLTACEKELQHPRVIERSYDTLSMNETKKAESAIAEIFGNDSTKIQRIYIAIFNSKDKNGNSFPGGDQLKDLTSGSLALVRHDTGNCQWSAPNSLGRGGNVAYAFVEMKCPNSQGPLEQFWRSFRLGLEIENDAVLNVCANLGDPANVLERRETSVAQSSRHG